MEKPKTCGKKADTGTGTKGIAGIGQERTTLARVSVKPDKGKIVGWNFVFPPPIGMGVRKTAPLYIYPADNYFKASWFIIKPYNLSAITEMPHFIKRATKYLLNLRQEQARQAEQMEILKASPLLHWNTCRDDNKKLDGSWQRSGLILPETKPSTLAIRL